MKYLMLFLSFSFALNASSQTENNSSNTSKVYFIRTTGFMASYVGIKTFVDSEFKCNLTNNKFKVYDVTIGKHTFSAQLKGEKLAPEVEKLEINVEPNHVYYVQVVLEAELMKNKFYCEEITENTALKKISKLEEDKKCQ